MPIRSCMLPIAAVVTLLSVAPAAQDGARRAGFRVVVSDRTAEGTDRGLRLNDRPREPRQGTTAEPYLRNSVVVKFRDGTTPTAREAMLSRVKAVRLRSLPYEDFDVVRIDPGANAEHVARQLSGQPDVEYAQARYRVHPQFVPNDPLYSRQWNYPAIDMERAWDINPGAGPSVVVAVLDSGVAFRNVIVRYDQTLPYELEPGVVFPSLGPVEVPYASAPDLGGADRFVSPRDFIWNDDLALDLDGHGTHVAGTIGQTTNNNVGVAGMAFNVRIMPVKVVDGVWDAVFNSPFIGTDDVVARGIRYAVDNGADVINMSIGRTGPPAPVLRAAISYAVSQGVFVVASGGNGFEDGNHIERSAEFAPQIDGMISVAAVGRDRRRAYYSTTGPYIEIAAPGGNQRTGTANGILQQTYDLDFVETYLDGVARYRPPRFDVFAYEFFQGTSMAAPHVSGFAALLIQQGITSPAAIEAAMKQYATDLGVTGRDDEFGYGLINPRAALRGMGLVR